MIRIIINNNDTNNDNNNNDDDNSETNENKTKNVMKMLGILGLFSTYRGRCIRLLIGSSGCSGLC